MPAHSERHEVDETGVHGVADPGDVEQLRDVGERSVGLAPVDDALREGKTVKLTYE